MKTIKILTFFLLILILIFNKAYAYENKILVKVDNEIITTMDIVNEIEYLSLINNNLKKLDKNEVFEISKRSIIREKIKIIELSKYFKSFDVDKKYYNLLLNKFIKKLNLKNISEFENYINERNIEINTIKNKLQIELLWNQLIVDKYSKDVKIDKDKIRKQINNNSYQKEYLISEILFTLDKEEKLDQKISKIKKDIKSKSFANAALIHSISESAENGGKLGWINFNALNPKIKKEILKINLGDYTSHIVVPGGFMILKIVDERNTKIKKDIDKEIEILSNEIANKQLNQFSNIFFKKIKKEIQIYEF